MERPSADGSQPKTISLIKRNYSHVRTTSGISSFGNRIHQLARYSEIAEFDVATFVHQDVGWFDVTMDNLQTFFQIIQSLDSL